jgi:hypothetical protein
VGHAHFAAAQAGVGVWRERYSGEQRTGTIPRPKPLDHDEVNNRQRMHVLQFGLWNPRSLKRAHEELGLDGLGDNFLLARDARFPPAPPWMTFGSCHNYFSLNTYKSAKQSKQAEYKRINIFFLSNMRRVYI